MDEKLWEAAAAGDIDQAATAITAGADVHWKNPAKYGM